MNERLAHCMLTIGSRNVWAEIKRIRDSGRAKSFIQIDGVGHSDGIAQVLTGTYL